MINKETISKVGKLAYLNIEDNDLEIYCGHFSQILGYVEQLNTLDTEDIKPVSHASEIFNIFRDDTAIDELSKEAIFQNAPDSENQFFRVPQILDNE